MNKLELERILRRYPVTVCAANELEIQKGQFVISNTDTSEGRGKHWLTFYFNNNGPFEYFDSLGRPPEYYGFQHLFQRPYLTNCDQIQDSNSSVCGQYCIYYIMCRYGGQTMQDIVLPFNVGDKSWNDDYVTTFVNKNKP